MDSEGPEVSAGCIIREMEDEWMNGWAFDPIIAHSFVMKMP